MMNLEQITNSVENKLVKDNEAFPWISIGMLIANIIADCINDPGDIRDWFSLSRWQRFALRLRSRETVREAGYRFGQIAPVSQKLAQAIEETAKEYLADISDEECQAIVQEAKLMKG